MRQRPRLYKISHQTSKVASLETSYTSAGLGPYHIRGLHQLGYHSPTLLSGAPSSSGTSRRTPAPDGASGGWTRRQQATVSYSQEIYASHNIPRSSPSSQSSPSALPLTQTWSFNDQLGPLAESRVFDLPSQLHHPIDQSPPSIGYSTSRSEGIQQDLDTHLQSQLGQYPYLYSTSTPCALIPIAPLRNVHNFIRAPAMGPSFPEAGGSRIVIKTFLTKWCFPRLLILDVLVSS